eukprot:1008150_1
MFSNNCDDMNLTLDVVIDNDMKPGVGSMVRLVPESTTVTPTSRRFTVDEDGGVLLHEEEVNQIETARLLSTRLTLDFISQVGFTPEKITSADDLVLYDRDAMLVLLWSMMSECERFGDAQMGYRDYCQRQAPSLTCQGHVILDDRLSW